MGDTENKLLTDEENKKKMEADRQKWIINRKRQRGHFQRISMMMRKLGENVDTEIWDKEIEPNI